MRETQGERVSATELLNKLFVRDCSGKLSRGRLKAAVGNRFEGEVS